VAHGVISTQRWAARRIIAMTTLPRSARRRTTPFFQEKTLMKRLASITGLIAACGIALMLAGCATTTSGPTLNAGPVLSKIVGTNVLMNDPGVLTLYATQACNVSAAQEYRLSIEACTGQYAALAGGAIIPANVISGINLLCQTLGYTGANNQLLVPSTISVAGNCMPTAMASNLPPLKHYD
jgi:hypothetical protein